MGPPFSRLDTASVGAVAALGRDQRRAPPIDGLFGPVGEATLNEGAQVVVEVRNAGAEGFVVADAARIVRIE